MPIFNWDVTKPAGTDPISQGDDQIRADKDTLRKVLRTLTPFGTATVSWREIQIGDDNYLAHNADYNGTSWNRDNTSLPARAIRYKSTGEVEFLYAAAGANPITWTVQAYVNPSGALVVGADPTGALEVATKRYVDNRFPRLINDVTVSGNATAVQINLAETVGSTTPLLIVGECNFNGIDYSLVFMRVNNDTLANYFSAWYGAGVTAGTEGPTNAARVVPKPDAARSAFWLLWMPVTSRLVAGQWTSGGPSGGGVHSHWVVNAAPTSFTFLVDNGNFVAGTRFLIWRLGP